jgi:hypothetical protein
MRSSSVLPPVMQDHHHRVMMGICIRGSRWRWTCLLLFLFLLERRQRKTNNIDLVNGTFKQVKECSAFLVAVAREVCSIRRLVGDAEVNIVAIATL